jgi:hypothetical protein
MRRHIDGHLEPGDARQLYRRDNDTRGAVVFRLLTIGGPASLHAASAETRSAERFRNAGVFESRRPNRAVILWHFERDLIPYALETGGGRTRTTAFQNRNSPIL